MATASDLFGKIEEFVGLSTQLHLTLPEEQTLMSLQPEEWERWRSMAVPATAPAPSLLVRRLDYAIALLRRMASAVSPPATPWKGAGERRL